MMTTIALQLWNDEAGFVISAELVLVSTVAVLSMIVGLAEVASGINQELEDVGTAFGSLNQSFRYSGVSGHKGHVVGSIFKDSRDDCDSECDIVCSSGPRPEGPHGHDRSN